MEMVGAVPLNRDALLRRFSSVDAASHTCILIYACKCAHMCVYHKRTEDLIMNVILFEKEALLKDHYFVIVGKTP